MAVHLASPQALYAEQRFSGHNVNIGVRQRREGTGEALAIAASARNGGALLMPLAHGLVLELSASVLAIIRRCLQTGRRAHTPASGSPNPSPADAFAKRVSRTVLTRGGPRNALRSWPAGRIVRKEGFREQGRR
jgi:hypothetical protein